jgi:hypothetical protein
VFRCAGLRCGVATKAVQRAMGPGGTASDPRPVDHADLLSGVLRCGLWHKLGVQRCTGVPPDEGQPALDVPLGKAPPFRQLVVMVLLETKSGVRNPRCSTEPRRKSLRERVAVFISPARPLARWRDGACSSRSSGVVRHPRGREPGETRGQPEAATCSAAANVTPAFGESDAQGASTGVMQTMARRLCPRSDQSPSGPACSRDVEEVEPGRLAADPAGTDDVGVYAERDPQSS